MCKKGRIIALNKGRYLHLRDDKIRMERSYDKIPNVNFSRNIINY